LTTRIVEIGEETIPEVHWKIEDIDIAIGLDGDEVG